MSTTELLLLFAGPALAAIGGFLLYASGPLFDRWERRVGRPPRA